jgi:transposase
MRKIIDVLRLSATTTLTTRQIATAVGLGETSVRDYRRRAAKAGLGWPLPLMLGDEPLDDAALERLLFPPPPPAAVERATPDFEHIHRELRRKGVTLNLLWQEYRHQHPDGYRYSRFCELYATWRDDLDIVMRQSHAPGERLFVDYAGMTMNILDRITGEIRSAQIFVAAMGASSYTFCEATFTQSSEDLIGSHVRCFAFLGGVPGIVVPDNLKSAVTRASRYEPEINRAYEAMAEHYGTVIIPARVRKPRDKAKVESAVQQVERRVLAPLRDRVFNSLAELNEAVRPLLEELNASPMAKLERSRRALFEELDRPALTPLPARAYEPADWRKARVNTDYHIDVGGHYYSVPFRLRGRQLDVRLTATAVEVFDGTERVASHLRDDHKGRHTTLTEHMPEKHRQYAEHSPERLIAWTRRVGEATVALAEAIIARRTHPEQGYRACQGLRRLAQSYGNMRLEAAASIAIANGSPSYRSVESILKHGIDQRPDRAALHQDDQLNAPIAHENIRGAEYYQRSGELSQTEHTPTTTEEHTAC